MTKSEQAFLGVALLALVAVFVYHFQKPGTGSVVNVPIDSTGYGDANNGPAYLMSNAPWGHQPWNGGAVIPQASAGQVGQTDGATEMAQGGYGCNAGGCG